MYLYITWLCVCMYVCIYIYIYAYVFDYSHFINISRWRQSHLVRLPLLRDQLLLLLLQVLYKGYYLCLLVIVLALCCFSDQDSLTCCRYCPKDRRCPSGPLLKMFPMHRWLHFPMEFHFCVSSGVLYIYIYTHIHIYAYTYAYAYA